MVTLKEIMVPFKEKESMARGDGLYKFVQKVGENVHKIEFWGDINISATFNVLLLTLNMRLTAINI